MIIKSMSRKEASFSQLLTYMSRDAADARFDLRHNLMSHDIMTMTAELESNARMMQKRKNGVMLYHEILSITRSQSLSADEQKEILRNIAQDYLKARAPGNLAYACLHQDKSDQLHYHFAISANAVGQSRRHRLTKAEFRKIQVDLEQRVLTLYPKLEQTLTIGKRKQRAAKLSDAGHQVKRKGQRLTKKDRIAAVLKDVFSLAATEQDLFKRLTDAGFELYHRGTAVGVRDTTAGTKHRLDTLGVGSAYAMMRQRLDTPETAIKDTTAMTLQKAKSLLPSMQGAAQVPKPSVATQLAGPNPETAHAVATQFTPNAVGAVAKEATGIMEIAVAQIGGPKPFVPSDQKPPQVQQLAPQQQPQAAAPLAKPQTELERVIEQRLEAMKKLYKDYEDNAHEQSSQLKR
jgi:Relaxase/Mobilisation nuclease domain